VARFVLLDHSLKGFVGHHYAYARLLLAAAREAGFEPVLAANRGLDALGPDFPAVELHRPFRYTTYCRHTHDARHRAERERGRLSGLSEFATRLARTRRIRSFAEACSALGRAVPLEEGDVVFAATMSELDFAGLARWLASEPATRRAAWHVQFHLNLFRGREGDYPRQEAVAALVRGVLAEALAPLGDHRLRLYCTTEPLARQYRYLGVGRFEVLPYPVDEAFTPWGDGTREERPLRVALVGHGRREKGYEHLQRLVDELWDPDLRTGRVQLAVQTRPGKLRLVLPAGARPGIEPVVFSPVGLPREAYVNLVRSTDIGLLPYDAERYYTRCSGVLLEMLCAGASVLVPAGTWLAEQIAEPIQSHLDGLASTHGPERAVASGRSFDAAPATIEAEVPSAAGDLLVSCSWSRPLEPGVYVKMETRQLDREGVEIGSSRHVLGPREGALPVRALVRLVEGAQSIHVVLRNAYGNTAVRIEGLMLTPVARDLPAGAVGCVAADLGETSALVREMIAHREHYRRTSRDFAERCRARHDASEVLRRLIAG